MKGQRCPRCRGNLYTDGYHDTACMLCGWRDYREARAIAEAEEAVRNADADEWRDAGLGNTRANRRASRRRNR